MGRVGLGSLMSGPVGEVCLPRVRLHPRFIQSQLAARTCVHAHTLEGSRSRSLRAEAFPERRYQPVQTERLVPHRFPKRQQACPKFGVAGSPVARGGG